MKKSTIALIVAAVVCLGLSAFSAKASVTRTNEAIEEIGEVTYSEARLRSTVQWSTTMHSTKTWTCRKK